MEYLKQIYYEMKHQKMMTWVSISGTALAIFLVMVFFIKDNALTVAVAPMSERGRILMGQYVQLTKDEGENWSGSFGRELGEKIYEGLEGVERISYYGSWLEKADAGATPESSNSFNLKKVDDEFWKICDFTFVDGRPFEPAEVKDNVDVAIITKSVAREIFNDEKVAGREILINMTPHRVVGVVEDVSPILTQAFSEIYKVHPREHEKFGPLNLMGYNAALLLLKKGVDEKDIQAQVKSRYNLINQEIKKEGWQLTYHEQPYSAETLAGDLFGSNNSPDNSAKNRRTLIIYAILIILPAINLSSMTRSRLRHRISEIGVRRAFGASKKGILSQLFIENFIITVIGGLIGLILCFLFVTLLSNYFFEFKDFWGDYGKLGEESRPTFEMLFTWSTFIVALAICLVLNILSATVPSWKAASVPPALAINKVR